MSIRVHEGDEAGHWNHRVENSNARWGNVPVYNDFNAARAWWRELHVLPEANGNNIVATVHTTYADYQPSNKTLHYSYN